MKGIAKDIWARIIECGKFAVRNGNAPLYAASAIGQACGLTPAQEKRLGKTLTEYAGTL